MGLRDQLLEAERKKAEKLEKNAAMAALMVDLRYIESRDGSTIDLYGLQGAISWHLVRCGWRPVAEHRMIKARRVVGKGVALSAIEWVPIDEPDDPLAELDTMTMAQINALPPAVRAQALRRMGGAETPDLQENPGWHVQTSITIEDAPDPADDNFDWN